MINAHDRRITHSAVAGAHPVIALPALLSAYQQPLPVVERLPRRSTPVTALVSLGLRARGPRGPPKLLEAARGLPQTDRRFFVLPCQQLLEACA